jgi:Ca2+-binding EF-hand superfamily protein
MYDKDFSGEVSVDETMAMLYSRYGKDRLEAEMKALFGDALSTDGDGKLTFLDYLKAVNKRAPAKAEAGKAGKK